MEAKEYSPFDFIIGDTACLSEVEGRYGKFLYVMQHGDGGPVKVGMAGSVLGRHKNIQCGNPVEVSICAVFMAGPIGRIEAAAHRMLAEYNIRGEWFDVSVLEAVEAVQKAAKKVQCLVLPIWESHAALSCIFGFRRDAKI
jgi:hypothetical protein